MEIPRGSVLLCGLHCELLGDPAVQVASLFASDRGAVEIFAGIARMRSMAVT